MHVWSTTKLIFEREKMSNQSKVILITGASSGIGLSTAVYLRNEGYTVLGTSRDPKQLSVDLLKKRYRREHTKYKWKNKQKTQVMAVKSLIPQNIETNLTQLISGIRFYTLDLTERNSIQLAIEGAWEEQSGQNGGIDVLINNAGSGYYGGIEDLSMDLIKHQFETSYFGHIRVIKTILPLMRPVGGQIINISSLAGLLAIPFQSQYSAAKSAMLRLTESLRNELSKFSIEVSAILPGDINTRFNAESIKLHDQSKEFENIDIDKMLESLPVAEGSTYYEDTKRVWKHIITNLITAPPPIKVAKKISKIVKSSKPKAQYYAGTIFENVLMKYIRKMLPYDLVVKLMGKFYGL